MRREGESFKGCGEIVVHMEADPSDGGQQGFGAKGKIGNGRRDRFTRGCEWGPERGGTAHIAGGNGRRHETVEGFGDRQICQIHVCGDQGRIQFGGADEMLQSVLHAMALQRLPFVVRMLEELVSLALLRLAGDFSIGSGGDAVALER